MTTAPSQPSAGGALGRTGSSGERLRHVTNSSPPHGRCWPTTPPRRRASRRSPTLPTRVRFVLPPLLEPRPSCSRPRSTTCLTSSRTARPAQHRCRRPRARLRPVGPSDLRLCRNRPEMAAALIRHGMHYMESPIGLAPRVLRDIQAGVAAARFQPTEPRLARAAVAGGLFATLKLALTDPDLVDDAASIATPNRSFAFSVRPTTMHAPSPTRLAGRRTPRIPLTPHGAQVTAGSAERAPLHRPARPPLPARLPRGSGCGSTGSRALAVDIATERTRNATTISAMPPATAKIPTSQTSVRMPLPARSAAAHRRPRSGTRRRASNPTTNRRPRRRGNARGSAIPPPLSLRRASTRRSRLREFRVPVGRVPPRPRSQFRSAGITDGRRPGGRGADETAP